MTRSHRTADERLVCLSQEDRSLFAGRSAQDLVSHCDSLLGEEQRLQVAIRKIRDRRSAIEVLAERAMAGERIQAVTIRRQHDAAQVVWRPHRDGTGFERTVIGPIKPDAGSG